MRFVSTWWLLGVVPWAAVAAYLVASSGRAVNVPFLRLWRGVGDDAPRRPKRRWRRPAASVVWALLGLLAGVVAAAGPVKRGREQAAIVVLDRGVTMAPAGGRVPIREAVDRATAVLAGRSATLLTVPPVPDQGGDWIASARAAPATAIDTAASLATTVAAAVRTAEGRPVVVLTNQTVADRPGVIRVSPDARVAAVGISELSARDQPRPQVMVRLTGPPALRTARVRVTSGTGRAEQDVPLTDGRGIAFIDLPAIGPTVSAAVVGSDAVDGRAWLAVSGHRPWVSATPGVATAAARMAAVFDRAEGAVDGVPIVVTDQPLAADVAGVQVVPVDSGGGVAVVSDHPLTSGIERWVGGGGAVPGGFTVVVTVDGRPTVAVRDGPVRQVWAAVNVAEWSPTADWVVFFADAFRWVAGGGRTAYTATGPRRLSAEWHRVDGESPPGVESGWWPGLYRDEDGRWLAINASLPAGLTPATSVPGPIPPTAATGPAVVAALGCLLAAALAWPSDRPRWRAVDAAPRQAFTTV